MSRTESRSLRLMTRARIVAVCTMAYASAPGSGPRQPISAVGAFIDQGVAGEETVGKRVKMRTVIRIDNDDRHVFELLFTRPGGKETLATRYTYSRVSQ